MREIVIGRNKNCDILLDERCRYASGRHGSIYMDGNQLMYRDHSTNGTLVNNIRVSKRAVPINYGDSIMLAGKYPVNWNQISQFFPDIDPSGSKYKKGLTEAYNDPNPSQVQSLFPSELNRWSWGAFALYPIWGFFNGCWWAILVWLFFGASIIPSILFGVMGRRWSWQYGQWDSVTNFEVSQSTWDKWGLIIFIVSIALAFLFILLMIGLFL